MHRFWLIMLFVLFPASSLLAQWWKVDSIESRLATLDLRQKVEYLDSLALAHKFLGRNFLKYMDSAVNMAGKIGDKQLLAKTLQAAGHSYYFSRYYDKAIVYYRLASTLYEQLGDYDNLYEVLHRIASSFYYRGDYAISIISNIQALELARENKDTIQIVRNAREIGYKYLKLYKFDSAYKYLQLSYNTVLKTGDIKNKALTFSEMGNYYYMTGRYDSALAYLHKALEYAMQYPERFVRALVYDHLGWVYLRKGVWDSALYYAGLASKFKDSRYLARTSELMAETYYKLGKYKLFVAYMDSATIWYSMNENYTKVAEVYQELYNYYLSKNMTDSVLCYLMMRSSAMDSIVSRYNKLQIKNIEIYRQINAFKKELSRINKKEYKARQRLRTLKLVILIFFVLLLIGLAFYFQQRKYLVQLKRKNKIISQKNTEILAQSVKLERQKKILETINEQMQESLRCALMIQEATLPRRKEFERFFDEFYLMYRPLQIVSGDFYWLHYDEDADSIFVVVADGTGHGVPGAFISLITERFLDEIVILQKEYSPSGILQKLNKLFEGLITKSKESLVILGVDLVVLRIDKTTGHNYKIVYASAKMPFAYYSPGEKLVYVQPENSSIGGVFDTGKNKIFAETALTVPPKTVFYLFSDGYKDQICNDTKRRITTKRFLQLLDGIKDLPIHEQGVRLEKYFDKCKNIIGQRDDVIVMIFKLK